MVRRDGAETRKERIQQIAQIVHASLHKNDGEVSLRKTFASIMLQMGLTKEKTTEYLELLQEAGQFILDMDKDKIQKVASNE